MHKVTKRLFWIVFVSLVMGPGTAASLTDSPAMAAPVSGGLIADPAKSQSTEIFQWRAGLHRIGRRARGLSLQGYQERQRHQERRPGRDHQRTAGRGA